MNTPTTANVDYMLERLLPCDSKREYELALVKLAKELEWGEPDARGRRDGDPINRYFWGLATRVQEYAARGDRKARSGPLTWVEAMVVRWATTTASGQAVRPDAAYLANLLRRSVGEVEGAMLSHGPAQGRKGFGLV